jgi:hypothetical protein
MKGKRHTTEDKVWILREADSDKTCWSSAAITAAGFAALVGMLSLFVC